MTDQLANIIISVILSLLSSVASFIMGGIWWIIKTQKKQAKQLDTAFTKIRELESINASYLDEDVTQADERSLLCENCSTRS